MVILREALGLRKSRAYTIEFDLSNLVLDINTQTGEIIMAQAVKKSTAWKDVPTQVI